MKKFTVLMGALLMAIVFVGSAMAFNVVEKKGEVVICQYTVDSMDEIQKAVGRRVFVDGVEIVQYDEQVICSALFSTYLVAHPTHAQYMVIIQPCLRFGNAESFAALKIYIDSLVATGAITESDRTEFQSILSTMGGVDLEDYVV